MSGWLGKYFKSKRCDRAADGALDDDDDFDGCCLFIVSCVLEMLLLEHDCIVVVGCMPPYIGRLRFYSLNCPFHVKRGFLVSKSTMMFFFSFAI